MRKIRVITLFPEFFKSPFETSLLGRAVREQNFIELIDLRQFGLGKYKSADDRPFGGGAGMVLSPTVCEAAISHCLKLGSSDSLSECESPSEFGTLDVLEKDVTAFRTSKGIEVWSRGAGQDLPLIIALSPQGKIWDAALARQLAQILKGNVDKSSAVQSVAKSPEHAVLRHLDSQDIQPLDEFPGRDIILFCGHYEGFDDRFLDALVHLQISVGDFVLTGGEPASLLLLDSIVRHLPGVVGKESSVQEDCFEPGTASLTPGGLRSGQYTRPREWRGRVVPEVLLSGDHEKIEDFRRQESEERTLQKRPDLIKSRASILSESSVTTKEAPSFGSSVPRPVAPVYVGLLHYPMVDRRNNVVTTAVTNLDIHDIARSCTTYGVKRFFIIHPSEEQHKVLQQILGHWQDSVQNNYHPARFKALSSVRLVHSFEEACNEILLDQSAADPTSRDRPQNPIVAMPDARPLPNSRDYEKIGELWRENRLSELMPQFHEGRPLFLLFGTGFGIAPEFFPKVDLILKPLKGPSSYNHLSVRAAAAVVLDRIFGNR